MSGGCRAAAALAMHRAAVALPGGDMTKSAGRHRGRTGAAYRAPRVVADLMQRDVVTISPDASVSDLIRTLRDNAIGGMPVVGADDELLGAVSSTDILWLAGSEDEHMAAFMAPSTLTSRTVRDIMTPDVFGVRPDTGLAELRRFFARTGVQRALVVEDNRVVGIVTLSDVLGTLVE
jgi:CBS domain-containing protein